VESGSTEGSGRGSEEASGGGGDLKSAKMCQIEAISVGCMGETLGLWYKMVHSSVRLVCSSVN
jgi:hypothetical protein